MLLSGSKPSRRQKGCYCTLQNHRGGKNGVTVPYKIAAEAKIVLLYPTKSPRRKKGCYCTLQNRRGGKNDVTVPYKTAAEVTIVLLYPTKSPRRKKGCYCTLQNRRGGKKDVTVPYKTIIRGKRKRSLPRTGKAPLYVCASYFLTIRFFSGNTTVGRKVFASSKSICA